MKLRIHRQSLRFRLSTRDIDQLREKKTLSERLELTVNLRWTYEIKVVTSIPNTEIKSYDSTISVEVPEKEFIQWLNGSKIEWEYVQTSPVSLQIIIEKDLK